MRYKLYVLVVIFSGCLTEIKNDEKKNSQELNNNQLNLYLKKAYELESAENYLAAITFYDSAISIKKDPGIINDRGLLYFELEDFENAISDFNLAVELGGDYKTAICITLSNLGRHDAARKCMEEEFDTHNDTNVYLINRVYVAYMDSNITDMDSVIEKFDNANLDERERNSIEETRINLLLILKDTSRACYFIRKLRDQYLKSQFKPIGCI